MSTEKMTVIVPMRFDADELWSQIMGAGWDIWDWWVGCKYVGGDWDKHCTLVVTSWGEDEGDDPNLYITREITIDDVVLALEALKDYGMVSEHLANQDFDANTSDCIIQQIVYGEVIYG